MTSFVAYHSRWRLALLILLAAGFVLAGLWIGGVFGDPPVSRRYPAIVVRSIGWFSVVFFGLCGLVAVRRFFDPSVQLEIDSRGIRSRSWPDRILPWSEIADVTTWTLKRQKTIVLRLRHPERFPAQGTAVLFSSANRMITGGDVSISLTGTNRSYDDAMSAIAYFRNQAEPSPLSLKPC